MKMNQEKDKEQWQREIRASQQNVTPPQYPEGLHYAKARILPAVRSQVRFWSGTLLIVVAAMFFNSRATIATFTVALGLVLSISGFFRLSSGSR